MIEINILRLAIKNIRRNLYEYLLFILTLTISVTIYFSFSSFSDNTLLLKNNPNLEIPITILLLGSKFIFIFLVIFAWNCNSFFIAKRKKDIAVYLILGMRKYQIALMLFFELIIIGFISIFLGIFLGILFLKLFWMFILSLSGLSSSLSNFYIPFAGIFKTIKAFFILFIVLGIFSYIKLWRTKIIGILNKKIPKKRNIFFLIIFSLISLILMFYGYKLAITSSVDAFLENISIAVLLVLVGTYLFFSSTLTMYIKLKRKNKFVYYRDLNMFTYANMESKIKENSKSLATITILLTAALIIVTIISNLFVKAKYYDKYDYPYSVAYINGTDEQNKAVKAYLENKIGKLKLENTVSVPSIKTTVSRDSFFTLEDFSGKYDIRIIPFSSLKILGSNSSINVPLPKEPNADECIYITQYFNYSDSLNKTQPKVMFHDLNEYKTISEFKPNSYIPTNLIADFIVINDELFNKLCINKKVDTLECLQFAENINKSSFDYNDFNKLRDTFNNNRFSFTIKDNHADSDTRLSSYAMFTGLIIAIVLLMCTANVIFFKQLSNAEEAKESYKLLKALGVEKNLLVKNVRKESSFIFFSPLLISILHAFTALTMVRKTLFNSNIAPTILSTTLFIIVYLIYYLLTVDIYFKIIDKES